eukprot:4720326-Pleurochrysis_carterae.AAC.1
MGKTPPSSSRRRASKYAEPSPQLCVLCMQGISPYAGRICRVPASLRIAHCEPRTSVPYGYKWVAGE